MCTNVTATPTSDSTTPLTRRTALLASAGLAASTALTISGLPTAAAEDRSGPHQSRHGRANLSYTLGEDFPAYVLGEEAVRTPGTTFEADGYYMQRWNIYEHIGTHVDAPAHFNPNGRYADELTPRELMVPAVVIDIADRAATDPDTVVTVADLRNHERRHGRIDEGAAVLMYSGWGAKVGDADAYRGTDYRRCAALPRLRDRRLRMAAATAADPGPRGGHAEP